MSTRFDAYAAGLVDGEGCITAKSTKAGTGMGIRVLIGMATKAGEVLKRMQTEYSGTLITQTPANPKHSDVTTWTVTGAEAASFLNRVLPHLLLKEEQALLALKIEEIRTSLPKIGKRDHHRWTPEALDRCQRIYRRIMELNKRGPMPPEQAPAGGAEIARLVAGLWVTDQADLFSDLGWEPFSGTWPRSGYMSGGRAFELPTSVPLITESASSSLLPTPVTQPDTGNGHARNLTKELKALPTPNAADGSGGRYNSTGHQSTLPGTVRTLPTPRASDPRASMTAPSAMQHVRDGFGSLAEVLGHHFLPTPKSADFRDSNGPAEAKRKSPSITAVSHYFPTPRTTDANGPGKHGTGGPDLRTVIAELSGAHTLPLFGDGND